MKARYRDGRTRLIVIGPLPPPLHGVTISTSLVLANRRLRDAFSVEHLDTSDRRSSGNVGKWDLQNVWLAIVAVLDVARRLHAPKGIVYLPMSQSSGGVLRDSLFVMVASLRGWRVAAHLRGGEFDAFYAQQPAPFRWWIRAALRRIDSMAIMGEAHRPMFDGLIAPERIVVVPNGTPDIEPAATERDPDLVLFLSNLRTRKGLPQAVQAAVRVIRSRPSARFVFVGGWEPGLEEPTRAVARAAGDRIAFLAPVSGDEKRDLLLRASVFLFPPAEPEGHPRVVLEAISAGLPIVTTDRGAIAETVGPDAGVVLADPDPPALAEALERLLSDNELRDRMGAAARSRYEALFTQEQADLRIARWLEGLRA